MRNPHSLTLATLKRRLLALGLVRAARRAQVSKVVLLEIEEQARELDCLDLGAEVFGQRFADIDQLRAYVGEG